MRLFYYYDKYIYTIDLAWGSHEEVFDSIHNCLWFFASWDTLLLDEHHFIFTHTTYKFYRNEPFTLTDYKQLIQEHIIHDKKKQPAIHQLIYHHTYHCNINGTPQDHYLGTLWQISFDLQCIYSNTYSDLPIDQLIEQGVTIRPSSQATISMINQQLPNNETYAILYIYRHSSKLLIIKNHLFHQAIPINLGSNQLKQMYQEQQMSKIYRDPNKVNPVTEKIVKETSGFFAKQLIERIKQHIDKEVPTVIVWELIDNHFIMDELKSYYSKLLWGYIIPYTLWNYTTDSVMPIDVMTYMSTISWNKQ